MTEPDSFMMEDFPSLRDDDLMARIARELGGKGSHAPFAEIVRRYQERVLGYVLTFLPDPAEAEDVAQEAFLALFTSARRYQPQASFLAYLLGIARKVALKRRRQFGQHAKGREEILNRMAAREGGVRQEGPDAILEARERRKGVLDALLQLPDEQREIVVLKVHHGLPYREIAQITGDTEGTLRSRLHHALQRLEQQLGSI